MFKILYLIIFIKLCNAEYGITVKRLPPIKMPRGCTYKILKIYHGPPVNQSCINCMCKILSNCDLGIECNGYTCGPFRISKLYWEDAGALKLQYSTDGDKSVAPLTDDEYYQDCANDYMCSVQTIQKYMGKYGIDCNGDDTLDCYDFTTLHFFGKNNCIGKAMPNYFFYKLKECLNE